MMTDGLRRRLGLGLLTLYGVGVMVGAGVYVLIGAVAGEAGAWAPWAFVLAGLIAAPTALSYAELSGRIPEAAGEAAYLREATGGMTAAVAVGLALVATGVISGAVVLQGGVGYLRALVDLPAPWLIVGIGVFLTATAVLGVVESLALAAAFTVTEVIGLMIVIGAGASAAPVVQPEVTGMAVPLGVAAGGILAFFAFLGFEDMVNMVEETKNPARTMPMAILLALILTTVLYVAVCWAAVRAVPVSALAESRQPLALVFETATGRSAGFLAAIAVAAALNGILAQIVMASRVLFGLGRNWRPARVFNHAHPRFGTPALATVLAGTAMIALALSAPLVKMAETSSMLLLAVFFAVNAALAVLKRRGPAAGGFVAPGWVPYLGMALSGLAFVWGVLG